MYFDLKNKLAAAVFAMCGVLASTAIYAQAAGNEVVQENVSAASDAGVLAVNTSTDGAAEAAGATGASDEMGADNSTEGQPELLAVEPEPVPPSVEEITADIKARFEKEFPGIVVEHVRPTRFAGIYELRIGSDLLYTNEQVEYVMQGALIDARNKEDLTAKSLDELMRVAFDSLPLQSAIKQVKGDGSRKMVVFEDPNCGYCKRLHQTLEGMDNYTVYTLLFPILSPDSTAKARNIWCAADRVEAWRNQMLSNQAPVDAQCETPIEANLALGRKLLVRGTPAIFFEDGSRVNGALPRDELEAQLDASTAAVR